MNGKRYAFILLNLLLLGCATSIQYVGKSYPPTTQVDVFFSPKDIKKPFEMMGTMSGTIGHYTDFNQMMDKIKGEARKRGADAVIILGIQEQENNPVDSSATEHGGELVNQSLVASHSKIYYGTPSSKPGTEFKGEFIKYK
jgi:hypothetical protein